jgi:hypothetical protein
MTTTSPESASLSGPSKLSAPIWRSGKSGLGVWKSGGLRRGWDPGRSPKRSDVRRLRAVSAVGRGSGRSVDDVPADEVADEDNGRDPARRDEPGAGPPRMRAAGRGRRCYRAASPARPRGIQWVEGVVVVDRQRRHSRELAIASLRPGAKTGSSPRATGRAAARRTAACHRQTAATITPSAVTTLTARRGEEPGQRPGEDAMTRIRPARWARSPD